MVLTDTRKEDQTITLGDRRRQKTKGLGLPVGTLLVGGAVDARTGAGKSLAATGSRSRLLEV